jgi:DNA-directed RNA polymerase subunit K/omega
MDDTSENAVRKPVTTALEEIAAGLITYQRVKQGVK